MAANPIYVPAAVVPAAAAFAFLPAVCARRTLVGNPPQVAVAFVHLQTRNHAQPKFEAAAAVESGVWLDGFEARATAAREDGWTVVLPQQIGDTVLGTEDKQAGLERGSVLDAGLSRWV